MSSMSLELPLDPRGADAEKRQLSRVQQRRRLVLLAAVVLLVASVPFLRSATGAGSVLHEMAEICGGLLILVCVLGRTWSSLYIAGSKRETIVDFGPYSVVRNPLYVFSVLGAAGVGLWSGSAVLAALLAGVTFAVFHGVVRSEERFLAGRFGPDFAEYCERVPRWIPAASRWADAERVSIRPSSVVSTFLESAVFLAAIPLFEAIEFLQQAGVFPVLLRLP